MEVIYIITTENDGIQISDYTVTAGDDGTAVTDIPPDWTLLFSPDGVDWSIVDYRGDNSFTQAESKVYSPGNVVWWRGAYNNDSPGNMTYSDNNRRVSYTGGERLILGSAILTTGKWYWEVQIQALSTFASTDVVSIGMTHVNLTWNSQFNPPFVYLHYRANGNIYRDNVSQFSGAPTYEGTGGITTLGFAYDADNGYLWCANSGVWVQGNPVTGASPFSVESTVLKAMAPAVGNDNGDDLDVVMLDGSSTGAFIYSVPSGFRPINQAATLNFSSDLVSEAQATEIIDGVKVGNRSITSASATSDSYGRSYNTIGAMPLSTVDASEVMSSAAVFEAAMASSAQAAGPTLALLRELITAGFDSTTSTSDTMSLVADLHASFSENVHAAIPVLLGDDAYEIWVMDTATAAMTRYEGFNFNSFATFRGTSYGASGAGLVSLGGDTDAGTEIDASLITGRDDFASDQLKRVSRAYLSFTGDGSMELRAIRDDGSIDTYTTFGDGTDEPIKRSVPMGKGARSHYWQFELRNVDGSDFKASQLSLVPVLLRRRVR